MDSLINKKHYEEGINYQIIGGEKQTLQIVLMPSQSIVTRKDALLYSSDNISSQHVAGSLFNRFM